ncbi:hypothetical protein DE146DRAFT_605558 [Phaeosphaeria sp. MPI-PUGE-AT-0046c]|nr:hypothetical protein DE146DRAFT_605558 [Phaeosphaeria sp. MPI-PUGE-AT-0046c]
MEISAEEILSTLIGPYDTQGFDYDALIPEVKEQLFNESFDWGSFKEAMMTRYLSHGVMFLTKEGYMGVYYRNYEREDDVDGTLVATALFGIRLPFILKRVASGRYKLWALAHFNGHKLGDEHVEAMGPDDDWRDLVKQGKMEEFVIV